jgi:transcriptional regulator with GAF, ATPase, and Fis domain
MAASYAPASVPSSARVARESEIMPAPSADSVSGAKPPPADSEALIAERQRALEQTQRYAVDFAALFKQERAKSRHLGRLSAALASMGNLNAEIAKCLELGPFVALVRTGLRTGLGFSGGELALFPGDESERARAAGVSLLPRGRATDALAERLAAGEVIEVTPGEEPAVARILAAGQLGGGAATRCLLAPLAGRARLLGFLVVTRAGEETGEEHRAVLQLLAAQAGIVLDNILLFRKKDEDIEQVERRAREERRALTERFRFDQIIGAAPCMRELFSLIETAATVDAPVLITGETGTGKDLVAQALHANGARRSGPFRSINCSALPEALLESALFGHEKGSFTGADRRVDGKVAAAQGGTLFLDEIGEMPLPLQAKLLRFLQDHTFERVGSTEIIHADVRVVAATLRELPQDIRDGRFRQDLFYRLNVIPIRVPPLSARLTDLPLLVQHFIEQANESFGRHVEGITPAAEAALRRRRFPGNLRELRNVIERAVIFCHGGLLAPDLFPAEEDTAVFSAAVGPAEETSEVLGARCEELGFTEVKQRHADEFEARLLRALLRKHQGHVTRAAKAGKMDKKNFSTKLRRHGIDYKEYRT